MLLMLILHFAGISKVMEDGSFDMTMLAVHYAVALLAFAAGMVIGIKFPGVKDKATQVWKQLSEAGTSSKERSGIALEGDSEGIVSGNNSDSIVSEDEEDFMKTKLGKIMTVLCVLLVIYMFVSAFCIYRLNAKINSVYTITQELQEDK